MQEFMVDTGDWKTFWERWRNTVDQIPGLKEELLERVGVRVQTEVHTAIEASGIHDSRGRVKRWQNPHKGSGLGYVAIRADSVKVPAGYRRKSDGSQSEELNAGALTNFLTSGHKIRSPSGRAKRKYKPRIYMDPLSGGTGVRGRGFYAKAKEKAESIARQEADSILQKLKEGLEG